LSQYSYLTTIAKPDTVIVLAIKSPFYLDALWLLCSLGVWFGGLEGEKMKDNELGLACVGIGVLVSIALVGGTLMNGWVLSILWGWFVVPLFGVSQISLLQAIGLTAIINMLKSTKVNTDKKSSSKGATEAIISAFVIVFVGPLVSLLFGWIIYSLM